MLPPIWNGQILDVFQKFPTIFVICAWIMKFRKSTPPPLASLAPGGWKNVASKTAHWAQCIAGIRTRFWTNLHAFVAVCGASPGHVVQWRQWHCQLCWVCHRRPNSRRSFNRNKAKKFRPKTTRPSRNWTVKLNTYHPEGRETLRSALGNGYVWFHSSLRSDELKRTLFPRAVSQCFAPFRMICN